MLRSPDSCRYDDILADAALAVVRADGVAGLTLRRLAQWIGVTAPALVNRFGSRDRVLAIALETLVDRWCRDQAARWRNEMRRADDRGQAWAALLAAEDDLADLPAWQALLAMADADPGQRTLVRRVKDDQRALVAATSRRGAAQPAEHKTVADLVTAVLDGLRAALADPGDPLDLAQARQVTARLSRALDAEAATRAMEDSEVA